MSSQTILVIDFDAATIDRAKSSLTQAGFKVEVARDGVAGLEAFEKLKPDLVLIEAMLPRKHGFEVCQEIKKTDYGKCTPILVTSKESKGTKYVADALRIYGCDEYLQKPIADDELVGFCRRLLPDSVPPPAPPSQPILSPQDAASSRLDDLTEDELMARLDGLIDAVTIDDGEALAGDATSAEEEERAARSKPIRDADLVSFCERVFSGSERESDKSDPSSAAAPDDTPVAAPPASTNSSAVRPPPLPPLTEEEVMGQLDALIADRRTGELETATAPQKPAAVSRPFAPTAPSKPKPTAVTGRPESRPVATPTRPKVEPVAARSRTGAGPTARSSVALPPANAGVSRRLWLAGLAAGGLVAVGLILLVLVRGETGEPAPQLAAELSVPAFPTEVPSRDDYRSLMQLEDPPAGPVVDRSSSDPAVPVRPQTRVARTPTPAVAKPTTPDSSASTPTRRTETASPRPSPTKPAAPQPSGERPRAEPKATPPAREPAAAARSSERASVEPQATPERPPVEIETLTADPTPTEVGAETGSTPSTAPDKPIEAAVTLSGLDDLFANPATGERLTEQDPEPASLFPSGSGPAEATTRETAPAEPPTPRARRGDLVALEAVETRPVPLKQQPPEYDPLSRRMRQEGTVVLKLLIDEKGRVAEVEQLEGIPGSRLNAEAARTVKGWHYRPATKDGVPVKVWITVDLDFRP